MFFPFCLSFVTAFTYTSINKSFLCSVGLPELGELSAEGGGRDHRGNHMPAGGQGHMSAD